VKNTATSPLLRPDEESGRQEQTRWYCADSKGDIWFVDMDKDTLIKLDAGGGGKTVDKIKSAGYWASISTLSSKVGRI